MFIVISLCAREEEEKKKRRFIPPLNIYVEADSNLKKIKDGIGCGKKMKAEL